MALTAKVSPLAFRADLGKIQRKVEAKIIKLLHRMGQKGVDYARVNRGYTIQTANLISSIGYIIQKDGVVIAETFNYESKTAKGDNEGRKFAKSFGLSYPKGFVLIIVAGMDYAYAVEARGRDVLTGSSIFIKQKMPEMVARLNQVL